MNKLKFIDLKKTKTKKKLIIQIFFNLQNRPTFHSDKRLVNDSMVNLVRGRVLCGSICYY